MVINREVTVFMMGLDGPLGPFDFWSWFNMKFEWRA